MTRDRESGRTLRSFIGGAATMALLGVAAAGGALYWLSLDGRTVQVVRSGGEVSGGPVLATAPVPTPLPTATAFTSPTPLSSATPAGPVLVSVVSSALMPVPAPTLAPQRTLPTPRPSPISLTPGKAARVRVTGKTGGGGVSPSNVIARRMPAGLLVPVQGVRPADLTDTYTQSRGQGRSHDAIDIPAPRGTPVVAASDGTVLKRFLSERGGTTLYVVGPDRRTIYYYAHLDRYADGIVEGKRVRKGELLAYVGNTGNAGANNYHLHFEIKTGDPKRFWAGTSHNPYPLLQPKGSR
jgi:murein DD-endopeptidase MepM/ murein hydrolase activator NlpD